MLIKNQFRGIQQKNLQIKPYEPEYKKLGVTPQHGNAALIQPMAAPRNVRVNSGQSEELAWMPKTRPPEEQRIKIQANIPPGVEHVKEKTFVNQNYDDGAANNVPIFYDEIPDFQRSVVGSDQNSQNTKETDETIAFSDVEFGEFVLLFEDQILGAGTYDEVTEAIEKILLSDESGTISPKSLIVFKRMQILTGVLIKDV
jgi:hypothetical protein